VDQLLKDEMAARLAAQVGQLQQPPEVLQVAVQVARRHDLVHAL
jgi:hypothetical protein